jgi:hypothetical protein
MTLMVSTHTWTSPSRQLTERETIDVVVNSIHRECHTAFAG